MPSIKSIALAATLAASTVAAYSTPLEIRNDLDLTPEDIDVLFGRDIEFESADVELLARDLDFAPEDLEILFARSPNLFSSALKIGKSVVGKVSKHKDTISKVGKNANSAFDQGSNIVSGVQQINGQRLQNKQTAIQNKQLQSGRARKRSILEDEDDEFELLARDLEVLFEDPEMWA